MTDELSPYQKIQEAQILLWMGDYVLYRFLLEYSGLKHIEDVREHYQEILDQIEGEELEGEKCHIK